MDEALPLRAARRVDGRDISIEAQRNEEVERADFLAEDFA